jgi:predicted ATPase
VPQLLGIRIRNYRSLHDVTIGQIKRNEGEPLPPMCCFIGTNGSGKSTLLDALGFIGDCLREGAEAACDRPHRGGFARLRTQGSSDPIEFTLYYKEADKARPITYSFRIGEHKGVPAVLSEELLQGRKGVKLGLPYPFLKLKAGRGKVWGGDLVGDTEGSRHDLVRLADTTKLGITTLGQLQDHPRIVGLRAYLEGWYLSYFLPDAARRLPPVGVHKHLDRTGENLGNVVQYLERSHARRFKKILQDIAERIPGIRSITHEKSPDNRLLLRFNESGYKDPFYQQSMSDGTLKMFAYLLLLADPEPFPFIGIEEPENGLYHKLLEDLARRFRQHAIDSAGKSQVVVTTHSPYFVDALEPTQVWMMKKNELGHAQAYRTADMPTIQAMINEGIPLGSLWYSNHLEENG